MKQSRRASLTEAVLNTLAGFGLSLAAQWFFLPLLGVAISFHQNLAFAVIMTVVSIARTFVLRRVFEALHIRVPLSPFMLAVMAERRRQVDVEGWTHAHDDAHAPGELAAAGAAYALAAPQWVKYPMTRATNNPPAPPQWPWSIDWWKPTGFRRDLIKACALIVADGERFDRNRGGRRDGA